MEAAIKALIKEYILKTCLGSDLEEFKKNIFTEYNGIRDVRGYLVPDNFPAKFAAPIAEHKGPTDPTFSPFASERFNRVLTAFCSDLNKVYKKNRGFDYIIGSTNGFQYSTLFLSGDSFDKNNLCSDALLKTFLNRSGVSWEDENLMSVSATCSTGLVMLNMATQILTSTEARNVLLVGLESEIIPSLSQIYFSLGMLTEATDLNLASIPFSPLRSGIVRGEGLVAIVLERFSPENFSTDSIVLRSGVTTSDAYSLTDGRPDGREVRRCLRQTLQSVKIPPEEIDLICAHGTSTIANDDLELVTLRSELGSAAKETPIAALKARLGHTLNVSGLVEVIACAEMIKQKKVIGLPGTYPLENLNMGSLVLSKETADHSHLERILKLSLGFGGINSTVLIEKLL